MDVLIIGAGFSGVYALYKLKNLGFSVLCLDRNDAVGGVWASNKYPGCKCDVYSKTYSYTWCEQVTKNWKWKDFYSRSDDIQSYLKEVVSFYKLSENIQLNTTIVKVQYDEEHGKWNLTTSTGERYVATFLVMATGNISEGIDLDVPGKEKFQGRILNAQKWPKDLTDFSGRKVAVIGTGSSACQLIPVVAKTCNSMHIFMRTPPYVLPARDRPLSEEEREYSDEFDQVKRKAHREGHCGNTFLIEHPTKTLTELLAEENGEEKVIKDFEARWISGGYGIVDISTDSAMVAGEGNKFLAKLLRQKISESVSDPDLLKALTPDHAPKCKRPVVVDGFYETLKQENVNLIPLNGASLEGFSEKGLIYLGGQETYFDDVIFCTGFKIITGAMTAIPVVGRNGVVLSNIWNKCPSSYLGLMVNKFPNMFTIMGPQSPSVLSNCISQIELHVDWLSNLLSKARQNGCDSIECDEQYQDNWVRENNEMAAYTVLGPQCNSSRTYYRGANVEGGNSDHVLPYVGGCAAYREVLKDVAENDYKGISISKFANVGEIVSS